MREAKKNIQNCSMHTLERPKKYVCTALKHSSKPKYQKWNYTLTHNLVFLFALSLSLLSLCLSLSLSLSSLPFFCVVPFFILHSSVYYVLLLLFMNICFLCRQYWCPRSAVPLCIAHFVSCAVLCVRSFIFAITNIL